MCKECNQEPCKGVNCPSVNNIAASGEMGVYWESLHSSEIDGVKYTDVTEEFLTRFNPYFVRKS